MNPEKRENLNFAIKAVYYPPDAATQSLNAPIYMSSSFQYDAEIYQRVVDGERKGVNNPYLALEYETAVFLRMCGKNGRFLPHHKIR